MRLVSGFSFCVLLIFAGRAHTAESGDVPAGLEVSDEMAQASTEFDNAKIEWEIADAQDDEAVAIVSKYLTSSTQERSALDRVAKAAARQVAAAREMKEARAAVQKAEHLKSSRPASSTGHRLRMTRQEQDQLSAAFNQLEARLDRANKAREVWDRARERVEALSSRMDPVLPKTKSDAPAKSPAPEMEGRYADLLEVAPAKPQTPAKPHSWWCATDFFNHTRQACWQTAQECEQSFGVTSQFHDCFEQANVSVLRFTQVNRGQVFMAFPLLSQCEKARKQLLKNSVDYQAVGRCRSSADGAP